MNQFEKVLEDLSVKTESMNGALDSVNQAGFDQNEVGYALTPRSTL